MEYDVAMAFFRRCLGDDWETDALPVKLYGKEIVDLLWPLNDVFRPRLGKIEAQPYDARFHAAADSALDDMARAEDLGALGAAPAGALRVLLERHRQLVCVAMANEEAGNPITTLPSGLSRDRQRIGIILLLLRSMELPWPPGGPRSPESH